MRSNQRTASRKPPPAVTKAATEARVCRAMARALPDLRFAGDWRRYQVLALDAFERDVAGGRRHTHIVAPPGSGKTLIGAEIVNRIGARALVLTPNSAVQAQWLRALERFEPDGTPLART